MLGGFILLTGYSVPQIGIVLCHIRALYTAGGLYQPRGISTEPKIYIHIDFNYYTYKTAYVRKNIRNTLFINGPV